MFRTAFLTLALVFAFSSVGYSQTHGHSRASHHRGFGSVGGFGAVGVVPYGYGYSGYGYGFGYPAFGYDPSFYPDYGYYPYYNYYPQTYNALGPFMGSIQQTIPGLGGW